jgi:hypothetical protein
MVDIISFDWNLRVSYNSTSHNFQTTLYSTSHNFQAYNLILWVDRIRLQKKLKLPNLFVLDLSY